MKLGIQESALATKEGQNNKTMSLKGQAERQRSSWPLPPQSEGLPFYKAIRLIPSVYKSTSDFGGAGRSSYLLTAEITRAKQTSVNKGAPEAAL